MFSDDVLKQAEEMEREWRKMAEQMGADALKPRKTWSGFELKPVYTPLDIKDMNFQDIGLPGQYPYTRSNYPLHYQVEPPMMNQGFGFNTPEETRQRKEFLEKIGFRRRVGKDDDPGTIKCVIDLPTQWGLDPDEPAARGKVGADGISFSNIHDFERLFDGVPLEKTFIAVGCSSNLIALVSLFAAYITEVRKVELAKTRHICINMYHSGWGHRDHSSFPPKTGTKLCVEVMKWHVENVPNTIMAVDHGYDAAEAGANPVLEVAFSLAHMIEIMEQCIKVGLDPDKVASQISCHPQLHLRVYETVAKIRAWRRLWARIMKERFGCTSPAALQHTFYTGQTAGSELPAIEVYNNIIRITIMAMAGLLGQVEGEWPSSFDEALSIPTEEAVQLSVRTMQILCEETDIPYVTDPFGGSYFMESLTNRIEEEVLKILKRMDDLGGYMKCWESGWMRGQVEKSGNDRMRKIDTGEWVKVGVNKYRVEEVSPYKAFPRPTEEGMKRVIETVKKYRTERDQAKTDKALDGVRKALLRMENNWPESCGEVFAACIEAAKARATAGEMGRIFREVFGYGHFSG
jgi:methylmalonyl-CoA mutase N-terminal domain/subunit